MLELNKTLYSRTQEKKLSYSQSFLEIKCQNYSHFPSEHLPVKYGKQPYPVHSKHISLVPHLHCPSVQVSVAPVQSSLVLHPIVIRKCINSWLHIGSQENFQNDNNIIVVQSIFTFHVCTITGWAIKRSGFGAKLQRSLMYITITILLIHSLTIRIRGARRKGTQDTCIAAITWCTHTTELCVSWKSLTYISNFVTPIHI